MANDNSSTTNPYPAQAEMDDILSSIRSGVAEEGGKVGSGSADLIEASAAQEQADEDVLELSEADMVAEGVSANEPEELIDLETFGASGEAKTVTDSGAAVAEELMQAEPVASAVADAADEFDRLLAEISQEQQQQVVAAKISKEDLLAEDAPLGEDELEAGDAAPDVASADEVLGENLLEGVAGKTVDAAPEAGAAVEAVASVAASAAVGEMAGAAAPAAVQAAVARFEVGAIQGPEGVQVAFPAEVLAMALRPMVQDWLVKNLPDVVEKLVKEEISKLAQG